MKTEEILMRKIASRLNKEIIKELDDQGHLLLTELEFSLRQNVKISTNGNDLLLEGMALDYIQRMEQGVKPSELGSKKQHFEKLYYFYLRIGFDSKKAKQKAYGLLPHHYREGVPTDYSLKHSKTGERKGFINTTWVREEKNIDLEMDLGMNQIFYENFKNQKSEKI